MLPRLFVDRDVPWEAAGRLFFAVRAGVAPWEAFLDTLSCWNKPIPFPEHFGREERDMWQNGPDLL